MAKKPKADDEMMPSNTLTVEQGKSETGAQAMARKLLEPHLRHAVTSSEFAGKVLGKDLEGPGLMDYVSHVQTVTAKAEAGDLAIASRLLVSQAVTLDSMFTELARRSAVNMGEYLDATERYARLAMRAQANCRTTLEALAKLHQPREQTVRHVHVNEGGQAVVTENLHVHAGGPRNAKPVKQSQATRAPRKRSTLPSQDTQGDGVPIASGKRAKKVQDARRDKSGAS